MRKHMEETKWHKLAEWPKAKKLETAKSYSELKSSRIKTNFNDM